MMRKWVLGLVLLLSTAVYAVPSKYTIQADTTYVQSGDLLLDAGMAQFDTLTATGPTTVDTITSTSIAILDTSRQDSTNIKKLSVFTSANFTGATVTGLSGLDSSTIAKFDSLFVGKTSKPVTPVFSVAFTAGKRVHGSYIKADTLIGNFAASDGNPAIALSADASGYITMPVQPSFLATLSTERTDVTGDGTTYNVVFNNEIYDQGSNWDGTTFTAPVTGRYRFSAKLLLQGVSTGTSHTSAELFIQASNRNEITRTLVTSASGALFSVQVSGEVDMDAADTCKLALQVNGGTKVVDVVADGGYCQFSGYLVH